MAEAVTQTTREDMRVRNTKAVAEGLRLLLLSSSISVLSILSLLGSIQLNSLLILIWRILSVMLPVFRVLTQPPSSLSRSPLTAA